MVESGASKTDVDYITFTNGNSKKNAQGFCDWVKENEIKKSQLVSFTMNETEIEDGDNMLTVFYRKNSIQENDVPLADLEFHHFSQHRGWADLDKDAHSQMRGVTPISLVHTAKNIGGARNQFLFYTKGSDPNG